MTEFELDGSIQLTFNSNSRYKTMIQFDFHAKGQINGVYFFKLLGGGACSAGRCVSLPNQQNAFQCSA